MDSTKPDTPLVRYKLAPTNTDGRAIELLSTLLADVASDVEVAARDSGISDASFVRCRRAMDRVACAQSVSESMRVGSAGAMGDEAVVQMREAVGLLARGWPEEYPAGTVEWWTLGG